MNFALQWYANEEQREKYLTKLSTEMVRLHVEIGVLYRFINPLRLQHRLGASA